MIKTNFEQQIKEKIGFQPTFQQEKALQSISNYIFSKDSFQAFILKGYAGTGKTTLVASVVKTLLELKQRVMLLAPTGRAAKVFSCYANYPAYTIHKRIYRENSTTSFEGDFDLNFNKYPNTIFFVDEASMIANSGLSGRKFGTGKLLEDLISFVFQGESCKLVLIGDTAQLPPVGEESCPALSKSALECLGLTVFNEEITQVVRQSAESGILYNATSIRYLLQNNHCHNIPRIKFNGFTDICRLSGTDLIESLNNSYYKVGEDETVVVCRSNKRANIYNNGIRFQVLDRENILCSGDRVIIAKNNYFWTEKIKEIDFVANGDMAIIRRVRNIREMYGFEFADVQLLFPDFNDTEIEATVLLNTLQSESPALSPADNELLFNRILEDYAYITNKKELFKALRSDPYYNAMQLKYAYALTCHKSQGGQWAHVYIDQGYITNERLTPDYFHWLYTAFTRATEQLFLVNWPENNEGA